MPCAVPGALLIELRPAPAMSVASVTPTANAASYRCRMPSASATVIVANDGRYLHRYVADHDSSLNSTSHSLLQPLVSRKGVIRFCSALCSCRRTNQSSNYFLQDHKLAPVNQIWNSLATSQWPWDTTSLQYLFELTDSPSTTHRTNGVALGSGRAK